MRLMGTELSQQVSSLTLEQKVAQRFMVGFNGPVPTQRIRDWLACGLGGVILFQDNVLELAQPWPSETANLLKALQACVPAGLPGAIISIDQEGGPVERLTARHMPTGVSQMALALSTEPEGNTTLAYSLLAEHLAGLGFTMDFAPTLDLNREKTNPIIGVRSFGANPQQNARLGVLAMQAMMNGGVCPVGKHFPGHGDGTVDSHLDLPRLNYSDDELLAFQTCIDAGLPAMLVSHGYYPALQDAVGEQGIPATASPTIVRTLLREQCRFDGVILTDDMCMGAITRHQDALSAALAALKAGVDILLYKQSTEVEWNVYQAIVDEYRAGRLDTSELDALVSRILQLKARFPARPLTQEQIHSRYATDVLGNKSRDLADKTVTVLRDTGLASRLDQNPAAPVLLVHPDRAGIHHYVADIPLSPELPECLRQAGIVNPVQSRVYLRGQVPETVFEGAEPPAWLIFVAYNALQDSSQAAAYRNFRKRYPNVPVCLVSASTPYDTDAMPDPDMHITLCTYRPASMAALAYKLAQRL